MDRLVAGSERTPEELYDQEWMQSLCAHAIEDLRKELEREGKALYLRVFERLDLQRSSTDPGSYATVAAELGLKESDVSNYLKACRRRFRSKIVDRIRDSVESEEEVGPELARVLELSSPS